jgi:hypothetical protein
MAINDYENFQFVIVQKLASYELDKLNEIIQVEIKER